MIRRVFALILALGILAAGVAAADWDWLEAPTPAEPGNSPEPAEPDETPAGEPPEANGAVETPPPADAAGTGAPATRLPLTGVKIGIDPGHQAHGNSEKETIAPNSSKTKPKVSSGTQGVRTGIAEYVTVLEISLKLREALESLGAEVYMTRDSHDVNISNQERARMMNGLGVGLVLRIHCDGAENSSSNGIGLYVSKSNDIAEESYRAAQCILPRMVAATGAKERGITRNDNYTGQNWSTVPCLMVECGFMSNPEEDVKLNDPDYQWKLVRGMTDGIVDFFDAAYE